MAEVLLDFISFLRNRGSRVSLSETLDALKVLSFTGYGDREAMKFSLAAVLAKSVEEEEIFQVCFDRYFSARPLSLQDLSRGKESLLRPEAGLSPLTRMLLEGDRMAAAKALRETIRAMLPNGLRYPVQQTVLVRRILEGMGLETLNGDIAMLSMAGSPMSGSTANALREAREELEAWAGEQVRRFFEFQGTRPAEEESRYRSMGLSRLDERQMDAMKGIIRRIVKRLNDIYWRRRKSWRRGGLDFRRTLRRSVPYGGVPFDVAWKKRKKEKADMMVLCDVSQSVRTVVRFFLLFLYSLNEELVRIRSFIFCSNLLEVSPLFDRCPPEEAIDRIQSGDGLDIRLGRTDYGQAFRDFKTSGMKTVTRKTTVIVLGDGRSNFYDPEAGILREIRDRAKRLIWLNPETRPFWGTGDSAMKQYLPCCTFVKECNTLGHLEGMVHYLLKK
jgi:uncharacterized protein with von Willebrand factor type A (vWA) domain